MSEDGANPSERPRIQITEKLAEFIHEQALIAATWRCPEHIDPNDVAQEVAFVLIRRPPRFDPNGKANVETFLKSCIRNRVHSAIRKEGRFSLRQAQVIEDKQRDKDDAKKIVRSPSLHNGERPFQQDIKEFTPEDVFRYIDCDSSRALCILYLECKANMSEVAKAPFAQHFLDAIATNLLRRLIGRSIIRRDGVPLLVLCHIVGVGIVHACCRLRRNCRSLLQAAV